MIKKNCRVRAAHAASCQVHKCTTCHPSHARNEATTPQAVESALLNSMSSLPFSATCNTTHAPAPKNHLTLKPAVIDGIERFVVLVVVEDLS